MRGLVSLLVGVYFLLAGTVPAMAGEVSVKKQPDLPISNVEVKPRSYNAKVVGTTNLSQCDAIFAGAKSLNIATIRICDDQRNNCFRRIKQTQGKGVAIVRADFEKVLKKLGYSANISVEVDTKKACK